MQKVGDHTRPFYYTRLIGSTFKVVKKAMTTKINKSRLILKGRVFNLFRDNITLVNGVTVDLDVIRHPGAAAIVAMDHDQNVILIKQYRYAVDDFIWEIPAGTLNANESALSCARRELTEETGFSAKAWEKLSKLIPVPGYSDEQITIFLATDLRPAEQKLDQDEILNIHKIPWREALEMIHNGQIQDAKSISGLSLADHRLKTGIRRYRQKKS